MRTSSLEAEIGVDVQDDAETLERDDIDDVSSGVVVPQSTNSGEVSDGRMEVEAWTGTDWWVSVGARAWTPVGQSGAGGEVPSRDGDNDEVAQAPLD